MIECKSDCLHTTYFLLYLFCFIFHCFGEILLGQKLRNDAKGRDEQICLIHGQDVHLLCLNKFSLRIRINTW